MIIYASHTKRLVRNSLDNTYDLIVQNLEKNIIQGRVQNPKHQFFFIPFCVYTYYARGLGPYVF